MALVALVAYDPRYTFIVTLQFMMQSSVKRTLWWALHVHEAVLLLVNSLLQSALIELIKNAGEMFYDDIRVVRVSFIFFPLL